jgi:hypothetical protein
MRWIRKTPATITQNANVRNLAGQISQLKSREPLIVHGTSIRNIHCSGVALAYDGALPVSVRLDPCPMTSTVPMEAGFWPIAPASVGDRSFINDV